MLEKIDSKNLVKEDVFSGFEKKAFHLNYSVFKVCLRPYEKIKNLPTISDFFFRRRR